MNNVRPINVFLKPTFWDVKFEELDFFSDKNFIIPRVLSRGTDKEVWFVVNFYEKETIISIINNTKGLDSKVINYFNKVL